MRVSRIRQCKQEDQSEKKGPKVRSASINQELQGDWNIILRKNIKKFSRLKEVLGNENQE